MTALQSAISSGFTVSREQLTASAPSAMIFSALLRERAMATISLSICSFLVIALPIKPDAPVMKTRTPLLSHFMV